MSFIQLQSVGGGKGKAGRVYVHLATSAWNPRRGRSEQSRVYLGSLGADGESVTVSKSFKGRGGDAVPLSEIRRRLAEGGDLQAWLHTPAAGKGVAMARPDTPAGVEVVGDAHVMLSIAEECGLRQVLSGAFGEEAGDALVGLAIHQAAEGRPLYLAGDWLSERALPEGMRGRKVSVAEVYGLMTRVGSDHGGRELFFREWIRRSGAAGALLCDTTSISTYSENLERAEWGHNRDGDDLPQVNISLAATADGLPLWFRMIPGSIPDVSTLRVSAELLRDLGMGAVAYSLDRGFHSAANVRDLLDAGDGFVVGIPMSLKKARELVKSKRAALASPKRSFSLNGRVMRHAKAAWDIQMPDKTSRCIEAHVFLDQARQADRVGRFEQAVFALEDKAARETFETRAEAVGWLAGNARGMAGCFAVETRGGTVSVVRKPRAVASATAGMGYMIVGASEAGLSPEKVLADYRARDLVEKLFDTLKNEDGQHRLRTGSDTCSEGRVMLGFIAMILHSRLEARMRDAGLLKRVTVAEFIAQARKIKAVRTLSGKRILLEVTKKSRELLSSVGIEIPS